MPSILQFTNPYGEQFYFLRLGLQWPTNPARRLIDATTPDRAEAREFATEELAREALVVAGSPANWTIVDP